MVSLPGLTNLENLNLSFTLVTDNGLKKLSGLASLKSLNLDTRQITDSGLAALTSKYFHASLEVSVFYLKCVLLKIYAKHFTISCFYSFLPFLSSNS